MTGATRTSAVGAGNPPDDRFGCFGPSPAGPYRPKLPSKVSEKTNAWSSYVPL